MYPWNEEDAFVRSHWNTWGLWEGSLWEGGPSRAAQFFGLPLEVRIYHFHHLDFWWKEVPPRQSQRTTHVGCLGSFLETGPKISWTLELAIRRIVELGVPSHPVEVFSDADTCYITVEEPYGVISPSTRKKVFQVLELSGLLQHHWNPEPILESHLLPEPPRRFSASQDRVSIPWHSTCFPVIHDRVDALWSSPFILRNVWRYERRMCLP